MSCSVCLLSTYSGLFCLTEQIESAEIRPAEMLTTEIWDCRAGGGELQATGGSGNAEA